LSLWPLAEVRPLIGKGKVADYIPALADIPAQQLGIFRSMPASQIRNTSSARATLPWLT